MVSNIHMKNPQEQNIELVKAAIEADPLFIHFLIGWLQRENHEDMADAAKRYNKPLEETHKVIDVAARFN